MQSMTIKQLILLDSTKKAGNYLSEAEIIGKKEKRTKIEEAMHAQKVILSKISFFLPTKALAIDYKVVQY